MQPGFAGTYTIFIHDLATDEAGLADVTNIVARMQGLVMLSQAWTAASGARTIQFTISTANSQNLAGNHASRNHLDFEIDFRDASNTVVTDRHLAIDVLASTPATDRGLTAEQEALLLPTFPATGSRDNKVPKFSGDTLGWEEDESGGTSSGGFEQRYELVEIPSTATAMSFGIEGEGTAPASLPGLSGTTYWYDYRSAHGKLFRVQGGSSSFIVNLADLIEINNGGFRDELAGSVFLFQNDKPGGIIDFTGGGIADIRPTITQGGARVTQGFAAICTLNPHSTNRFALLVAAWNRADTDDRLLPTFPATGSRNGKILKFNEDALRWIDDHALEPVQITQSAYDALTTKGANTVYYIVG